jgi:[ribosomal protein S18]-alanine N-acetyltransferase
MIDIVEGDARDISAIMPIMENAFDPAFGEAWTAAQCLSALAMPGCRLLMARQDQTICGFAMTRWVLDTEELLMIGVSQSTQRRAVGSKLLQEIVRLANEENRVQLFLEVRDGNPAYYFYARFGFQPIGRRKQYYKGADGARPDAITMTLNIPDSCD